MTQYVLVIVGTLLILVSLYFPSTVSVPVQKPEVIVSAAEVSDLIKRLRPLAKDPAARWYSNGITLTFYGSGVSIQLKTPNGNEYNGRADTLEEAVARITSPSAEIQDALRGWPR